MKDVNLNELAKKAYENAKKKGFHDEKHTDGHWFMLVVCELAEAVEADRSDRWADRQEYERLVGVCEDVVQPHLFEMYIKDTVEDELADAVIRLLDFSGMKGFDIDRRLGKIDFAEDDEKDDEKDGKMMSFAGKVYDIVSMLCFDEYVEYTMGDIFRLAYRRGIDLMWFVKEKMKYNEKRELLHGKLY